MNFARRPHFHSQIAQKVILLVAIAITLSLTARGLAQARTWTSADGSKSFDAELKTYDGASGKVTVVRADGRTASFSRDVLSDADQNFLEKVAASAPRANSLGMKFVPIEIAGDLEDTPIVLFSIWETRVQDFRAFIKGQNTYRYKSEGGYGWDNLVIFEQGDDHPVVFVNWEDASAFCRWLTATERAAGKIGPKDVYRLPTDHEWSCAAGIGDREDPSAEPASKRGQLDGFPWGNQWPPGNGTANLASKEVKKKSPTSEVIPGLADGFAFTAPVGSFAAAESGLYDLGGNVSEWCADPPRHDLPPTSNAAKFRVSRGGGWSETRQELLLASYRGDTPKDSRSHGQGFRVVLELGQSGASEEGE